MLNGKIHYRRSRLLNSSTPLQMLMKHGTICNNTSHQNLKKKQLFRSLS